MSNGTVPVLALHGLIVEIGAARPVDGLSLTVMPGERVCLLGASGSGKSLTAAAVLGLLPPQARVRGSIRLAGHEVGHLAVALRPRGAQAAMVFQDSHSALNPLVPIGTQLREALRRRQDLRRAAAARAAAGLLRAMRLPAPEDILRRCPAEISGGQRQRVCIALALACKAPLLVADEPTTALDVVTQAQVLDVLKAATDGPGAPALLFVTHDLGAAARLCHRAVVIADGAAVEAGDMDALLLEPRHAFTRGMVAAARAGSLGRARAAAGAGG